MNSSPPSSISCSLEHAGAETDDHSEVTWQCGDDEHHPSHADDFGITLAADPYFFYMLDKRHSPKDTKQQLVALKLQIAKQQERLDARAAENAALRTENAALRAENAQLVHELSLSSRPSGASTAPPTAEAARANDRARLAVTVEVLRKSLKRQIDDGRKGKQMDEARIAELQRTNDSLRRALRESSAGRVPANKASAAKLEASVCTATTASMTASESFSDREGADASLRRHSSCTLRGSMRSIPEGLRQQFQDDDCCASSSENGDKVIDLVGRKPGPRGGVPPGNAPSPPGRPPSHRRGGVAELHHEFADDEARRRKSEEVPSCPRKSEELLVGFDEAARRSSQGAAVQVRRRWSSLKW